MAREEFQIELHKATLLKIQTSVAVQTHIAIKEQNHSQ